MPNLERSRSGNGGHIWFFFDKAYPGYRSRKVVINLLQKAGVFSVFDKNSSFDRLFPNQDTHSGKGLGNLIALPFQKTPLDKGNSCFINPITFEPYPNQWKFLETIKRISVQNTSFDIPYNSKTDTFEMLSKMLIHDTERNKQIVNDIKNELNKGKKAVIITERLAHIETLNQFLKQSYEIITLSGDDKESEQNRKWGLLKKGDFQAIITTGQFFGEGSVLQNVSALFLVYPFSYKGKLIQYIGRVQRSELTPIIYDYRDIKIPYLNRIFLKRNTYYRQLDRQATLFDDLDEFQNTTKDSVKIEKTIKIPIEQFVLAP